tara:strand:+ start:375049 stop:376857 length:1809 start_codon:yes stop_codon:yes gene_type:complete
MLESRRLLAAAPDLVQFAKDLGAADVKFYCAAWFEGCTTQTSIFDDGAKDLPFTEVTGGDRLINQDGIDAMINDVPAWDFPGQPRHEGFLELDAISQMSGVPIPMSETPSFDPLSPQTLLIGSPLHLPIDAYDPDGNELTVTVTVDNPSLVQATVLSGNRSLRIDMEGFGDMVFELFDQRAPVPASRVAGLAESGFYDGLTFHRVADGFVLQGGDPLGNGRGGSDLPDFDDQFHPDLQHNRTGILSFAKSADDTNNSQFFITEGTTRHLDFNHSIFGQMVEGEHVRESISGMDTNGLPENRPDVPIVMNKVEVFNDTENAVVFLKALGDTSVSTSVTIRVTDTDGNFSEQTVPIAIEPDFVNAQPYLDAFEVPAELWANQSLQIQLPGVDVEGDPILYVAEFIAGDIAADVQVDSETGLMTITPEQDGVGRIRIGAGAFLPQGVDENGEPRDTQFFELDVIEPPFHRLAMPNDVNGDGVLTSADAFAIINTLSRSGGEIELGSAVADGLNPELRVNVVPDSRISVLDALVVINALERDGIGNNGESESSEADTGALESAASSTGLLRPVDSASLHAAVFASTDWIRDDDEELLRYPAVARLG